MIEAVKANSEILTALVTIIAGGIIRAVEKHRLRKHGKLKDQGEDESFTLDEKKK